MAVEPPEDEKEGPEKDDERSEESSISTVYQYKSSSRGNSVSNYRNWS